MRTRVALASALLLSVIAATPATAQAPPDGWRVTIAPYFMGAAMKGTSAVAGQEVKIDMSFSDILSNLQFGAMGLVVARKGSWGVGGDAIWMALDWVFDQTGTVIPLADFLYTDVYDRLMGKVQRGVYLGIHEAAGVPCHHPSFEQATIDWQI